MNNYRINADKVYVTKDTVLHSFIISYLVITKDSVTESDSEGNLIKRYYYVPASDSIVQIWNV